MRCWEKMVRKINVDEQFLPVSFPADSGEVEFNAKKDKKNDDPAVRKTWNCIRSPGTEPVQ